MITQHDIVAITNLLERTPMLPAETIYASDLVRRLAQLVQPAAPTEAKPRRARKATAPAAEATPPVEPPEPIAPLRPPPLAGY
jgi:hypothetical protein